MTDAAPRRRSAPVARRRPSRDLRRALGDRRALVLLVAATLALGLGTVVWPDRVPLNTLTVPMVVSTLLLRPRELAGYATYALGVLALAVTEQVLTQPDLFTPRIWASVGTYTLIGLLVLVISLRRARLGVAGAEGEAMLVDLRDRLQAQGRPPVLPAGWEVDVRVRAADGTPFSGDFVCFASGCPAERRERLDAVLVDVSGKGARAGSRSLQLSGALSGLLGAVEPPALLPAVNDFLVRQSWQEGFATAVQLSVDLATGDYRVSLAGHPPALVLDADGVVRRVGEGGPLLGLLEGAPYPAATGRLAPGEAVVLYTDGLVEVPGVDIDEGIDLLAGVVAAEVRSGRAGVSARIVAATGTPGDDRAALVLRRA